MEDREVTHEDAQHEEAVASACFVGVPLWLLRRGDLTPTAKLVYGYIAFRLGANPEAWPAQETIAADLGCSVRTVKAAIASLVDAGLVAKRRRGLGMTNLYRLARRPNSGERHPSNAENDGPLHHGEADCAPEKCKNFPLQKGKNCTQKEQVKRTREKYNPFGDRGARSEDEGGVSERSERAGPFHVVEAVLTKIAERFGQPPPDRRDVLRHLKEWDPLRRLAEHYGPEKAAELYIREAERRLDHGRNDPPTWSWLLENAGVLASTWEDRLARMVEDGQKRYELLKAMANGTYRRIAEADDDDGEED